MSTINQHPALLYSDEIGEICRPLEKLNITYFVHAHVDQAKQLTAITNGAPYFKHYLQKKYYNVDIHTAHAGLLKDYFVWDVVERSGLSAQMNEDAVAFGAKHPFTIIQKNKDGVDYYHFATGLMDQSINQIYISHMDLLKLFIAHFKEKVNESPLLKRAYDVKFAIDQQAEGFTTCLADKEIDPDKMRQSFLKEIGIKDAYLSKRELECLQHTLKGQSAKQIAQALGLSYRTVEEHLANIKKKMGVDSKSELIAKTIDRL